MKVLSLFSGIGATEKALERENISFDLVNYCEIDKYASKAYSLIHNIDESKNLGDITKVKVEDIPYCDMISHTSPCQSFSTAGKGEGGDKGSGTESSLMWYSVDIILKMKPKIVLWENVPNVLSKSHFHNFQEYLTTLEKAGYTNSYKVLNAANYGVPQSRKRLFCISLLGDKEFIFPEGENKITKLADVLEKDVDKKYYYDDEKVKTFIRNTEKCKSNKIQLLGRLPAFNGFDICKRLYGIEGVSPTLNTASSGNTIPKISCAIHGRYYKDKLIQNILFKQDFNAYTLTTAYKDSCVLDDKVRRLTPKECFRLMGFDDEDYEKIKDFSDSRLYKLAGNSIVVNVLQAIFKELFNEQL